MLCQSCFSNSRNNDSKNLKEILTNINNLEFDLAKNNSNNLVDVSLKFITKNFINIIADNGQSKLEILLNSNYEMVQAVSLIEKSINHLSNGYILLLYKNERVKSYKSFLNGYKLALKTKSTPLIKLSLISLLKFYRKGTLQNDNNYYKYLIDYRVLCETKADFLHYYSNQFNLISQTEIYNEKTSKNDSIYKVIFSSYDLVAKKMHNKNKLLVIYNNDKGNYLIREAPATAKKFYSKVIHLSDTTSFFKPYIYYAYSNLSRVSSLLNKPRNGLNYLKKAKKYRNINDSIKNNLALNIYRANHYEKLKKFDSAYYYIKEARILGYKYNFQKHNTEISKIKVELDTEKKERDNLKLKNILIIFSLLTISGSIIGYLMLKNSRKKQLLAEQQKELATQKNLTLLKEQELITINAMVDGQEKERTRIAEDLHDNLGSVLATLKLHFENLKFNKDKKKLDQEALFNKTENLIDEAYLKVRRIAHAKNAGVIASQGLLASIQVMAKKISAADNISIEVVHYGLEKRLENSLEIGVFRIVQELITNTMKHANARNATINLSLYDNALTIIVEDNGLGFDIEKVDLTKSMGLHSIQTRIAHLNGTLVIDSTVNKGTSIILNIPVS